MKPRAPASPAAVDEVVTPLPAADAFADRHIGPRSDELPAMLGPLGYHDLDELIEAVVPESIRLERPLDLPPPLTEAEALAALGELAGGNRVFKSYIGMGYHDTFTPPVILRNIVENPGWYTAYTPYQAEISQGRMEALVVFQTMVADLTGLPVANASLLDEGTAAAEAMAMTIAVTGRREGPAYLVDRGCHPQTIAVVRTRAEARGIRVQVVDVAAARIDPDVAGVLIQYPTTEGAVRDWRELCERVHGAGGLVTAATDLLALTLLLTLTAPAGASQAPTVDAAEAVRAAEADRWRPAIERGRATLQGLIDRGEAPGCSVAVAVGGRVVWSEGFGWADLEQRVAVTADTRFGIGSISKSLTAAGLVALADAGQLDLDAPVERYVPDFPNPGRGVTLRRRNSRRRLRARRLTRRASRRPRRSNGQNRWTRCCAICRRVRRIAAWSSRWATCCSTRAMPNSARVACVSSTASPTSCASIRSDA